jgi:hypothetical protein
VVGFALMQIVSKRVILSLALGLCLGVVGALVALSISVVSPGKIEVTYVDLVTIILSVLSVFLTFAGIILGIFAFIGWTSLAGRAEDHAQKATFQFLETEMKIGGRIYVMFQEKSIQGIKTLEQKSEEAALEADGEI